MKNTDLIRGELSQINIAVCSQRGFFGFICGHKQPGTPSTINNVNKSNISNRKGYWDRKLAKMVVVYLRKCIESALVEKDISFLEWQQLNIGLEII